VFILKTLDTLPQLYANPCTVEQASRILTLMDEYCKDKLDIQRTYDYSITQSVLFSVFLNDKEIINKPHSQGFYLRESLAEQYNKLLEFCSIEFIKKMTHEQKRYALVLCNDCDKPASGGLFKSMNEIEKAHDERTARVTKELMAQAGDDIFIYHPRLAELAAENGFLMPEGPAAMIKRGHQHNNCVGTYAERHTRFTQFTDDDKFLTTWILRLFFTGLATLELQIEYNASSIISTKYMQYKGRYNRDIAPDKGLTGLRIALVGEHPDILIVARQKIIEKFFHRDISCRCGGGKNIV